MYSPLRQVEAQREVIRKIWESRANTMDKLLYSKDFNKYRKVLVVASNKETILDTSKAPSDIKYKVSQIEQSNISKGYDDIITSKSETAV